MSAFTDELRRIGRYRDETEGRFVHRGAPKVDWPISLVAGQSINWHPLHDAHELLALHDILMVRGAAHTAGWERA